jgi:prepilin-type N-terminal cleavage/methylation domain-containing protein
MKNNTKNVSLSYSGFIEAKKIHRRSGFTLIELLIAIAVIGILVGGLAIGGPAMLRKARISKTQSEIQQYRNIVIDAAAQLGGTLPITEGGAALPTTSGASLGASTAGNFYNHARLEHVLMSLRAPLLRQFVTSKMGNQNNLRADGVVGGNELIYNPTTQTWSTSPADVTIAAGMSYASTTRLECILANSAATPGAGTNFILGNGAAGISTGARIAVYIIPGVPGLEAAALASEVNGAGSMTDTANNGTVAQTRGTVTYNASATGTNDLYIYLADF